MIAKITYDIAGQNNFLSRAEYSFEIFNFLNSFEDQFQLAEQVEIVFEDEINPDPKNLPTLDIEVSDDGKEIKAYYKTYRYSDGKNGLSKPDEVSFFKGLRHYLINTVIKEDNERY
ncbi:hypothetical protein [Polaribacter sp. AHE13PA]|uniref:hypothetical protein n=1 Tax=Polaribacter sp. AHE13PA TaxID=2745562 RepID=UPI001C4FD7CF|nr:hypothetical protein [Polaribacter sp. AHE13PA]QXP65745.1 hypothetical protein H0I28_11100 [Polaribacter sp. AHE13PA]